MDSYDKHGKIEEISGIIENVIYINESNDYTVMEISCNEKILTAVGNIPMAFEGEEVVLRGEFVYHKEFGKQFLFSSFEKRLPEDIEGILHYLSSRTIKGVGPVTALKIVNKFGADSFDVIENHCEWLADIPGITMKKAAVISDSFREQSGMRNLLMFCRDYIGTNDASKIYKKFGGEAVGILKTNPYVLCDGEFGISFDRTDKLAKSLGVIEDSPIRVLCGFKYLIYRFGVNFGHTCVPVSDLISEGCGLLGLDEKKLKSILNELLADEELTLSKIDGLEVVMTNETADDEEYIAKRLFKMSKETPTFVASDISSLVEMVEQELNIGFASLQREAIFSAMENGVMILTGGPGTGKTTIIKALITIFDSIKMKTVLAAPTGRAAKRMSESTSCEAKTVHRMLGMERTADGDVKFCRNEQAPLNESVVIIDEASMLDLSLMASLMRALKRGSRLILIGDADQLPSVGAGNVFADLIASERIKTVRLTEIYRQSKESMIVTNAHRINSGDAPILSKTDSDFFFVRRENEKDISDTIASLVTDRLPKTYGKSIRDQIQVITPSRKGVGGVENLNTVLQQHINPPMKFKKEKSAHGTLFREGDRVMQIVNNYDIEWEKGGVEGVGLFNGDIGVISSIDYTKEVMHINFDDKQVSYSFDNLDELELSYAITVHKSQGSEYPVVIIPMYYCAPMLMTRNLFYTGITRAKKMVILVGRSDIPIKMVENNTEILRYTTLKRKIIEYY